MLRVQPNGARSWVFRFFHEYGRRKPGGANRCHEILRNMFDCAIVWGHRPEDAGSPCFGTLSEAAERVAVAIQGKLGGNVEGESSDVG